MFSKARILGIALVLLFPILASAQSLGSVAKKERERREKNKAEGVTARQISEDEVGTTDGEEEEAVEGAPAAAEEGEEGETTDGDSGGGVPASPFSTTIDLSEQKRQSLDDEQAERRRQESQWKARSQQARDRLEAARRRVQQLEGLHLVEGERYVDANGNTVISSPEHLKRLVDQANGELKAAELSLEQLREEARRKGIPPGWLR
jgi:hypothetical protein